MSETVDLSHLPATFDELKSKRVRFAVSFLLVMGARWCLRVILPSLAGDTDAAVAVAVVTVLPIIIVSQIVLAVIAWAFAGRVGMRRPWLAGLLGLLPLVTWVAFFIILAFVPEYLKPEAVPDHVKPSWYRWAPLAGLWPIALAFFLFVVNPTYMGHLFVGPPWVGSSSIPLGWPMMTVALLMLAVATGALWLGFWKEKVRGAGMVILMAVVQLLLVFPAAIFVMLAPLFLIMAANPPR